MEVKLDRADKLVTGLAGERVRWEERATVRQTSCCCNTSVTPESTAHWSDSYLTPDPGRAGQIQLCYVSVFTSGSWREHGIPGRGLSPCSLFPLIYGTLSFQLQRWAAFHLDEWGDDKTHNVPRTRFWVQVPNFIQSVLHQEGHPNALALCFV